MRELWILIITALAAYFWTAELWRGNVWGAALVMALGVAVSIGGVALVHFREAIWQRLAK